MTTTVNRDIMLLQRGIKAMKDTAQDTYEAVEELIRHLHRELVSTIKLRDSLDVHKDVLTLRAMEIETRIAEAAALEMRLRRAS